MSLIEALMPKTESTVGNYDCAKWTPDASTYKAQGSAEPPACAEPPASDVAASTIICMAEKPASTDSPAAACSEPPASADSPAVACSTVGGGGKVAGAGGGSGGGGGGCAGNLAAPK